MKRLDEIPVWLFAFLTVAAFDAIALGGLLCMRRWGRWLGLYALVDNNTVGWIFSAILVMYALALGLIAVATWGNAATASVAASQEASHIVTVYRTLAGYPQPLQSDLTRSILRYTESIIQNVWPAQQRGEVTEKGTEILLDEAAKHTSSTKREPDPTSIFGEVATRRLPGSPASHYNGCGVGPEK